MVPPKHRLLRFTTLFTSTRSSAVRVGGLGSIFYQEIFRTGFTAIGTDKSPNSGFCGGALTRLDDNVGVSSSVQVGRVLDAEVSVIFDYASR